MTPCFVVGDDTNKGRGFYLTPIMVGLRLCDDDPDNYLERRLSADKGRESLYATLQLT